MTTLKIGSNVSLPTSNLSTTVDRPAAPARPPVTQVALASPDVFMPGGSVFDNGMAADRLGGPSTLTAPGTLPEALEPFREALDNIAQQITPELFSNPSRMMEFIRDAVRELGVAGQHFMDVLSYVGQQYAYNSGKTRLAQGEVPATPTIA